jgi:hypothetical protein
MPAANIPIMWFSEEHSALAAKAKLEALGIEAIIVKEDSEEDEQTGQIYEDFSVCVNEEDVLVAKEILEETMDDRELFHSNDI